MIPQALNYYGNRPSVESDHEDELLLEKEGPRTPGIVERGPIGPDEDEGEGLVIGGKREKQSSLRALAIALIGLILTAGMFD